MCVYMYIYTHTYVCIYKSFLFFFFSEGLKINANAMYKFNKKTNTLYSKSVISVAF